MKNKFNKMKCNIKDSYDDEWLENFHAHNQSKLKAKLKRDRNKVKSTLKGAVF